MSRQAHNKSRWLPKLTAGAGTVARKLADAVAADVASGKLSTGDQLPTQRDLARHLGVTTGTVNRGYAIAEREGIISAETGRGSFVSAQSGAAIESTGLTLKSPGSVDLALNYPNSDDAEQMLGKTLSRIARTGNSSRLLGLSSYAGRMKHRVSGAHWLKQFGLSVEAEAVMISTSVQHGLAASLAALTVPGDVVLTESLTSPGMKSLAAMHHLRLVPVAGDEEGILPDALAKACKASGARVFYTMPTLHTPTAITMSHARRRAVADVLKRHKLTAIEDDAWGFLAAGAVAPLQSLAPESVVYLTSFSKSIAPGLRVGYVVSPHHLQQAITTCIGTMTWTPPLLAELASQWIEDGTAESIMKRRIETARERYALAAKTLRRNFHLSKFPAFHLWLHLSEPWRTNDFISHAEKLGVTLAATDIFVPGRAETPHAVRVCLGTEPQMKRVEESLRSLAGMLKSGPTGYSVAGI